MHLESLRPALKNKIKQEAKASALVLTSCFLIKRERETSVRYQVIESRVQQLSVEGYWRAAALRAVEAATARGELLLSFGTGGSSQALSLLDSMTSMTSQAWDLTCRR